MAAAGLRITPSDPATTIGHADIWADPKTGFPVRVELAGRSGKPVFITRFLELRQRAPDLDVLKPALPHRPDLDTTELGNDLTIPWLGTAMLPSTIVGRNGAEPDGISGVGTYGQGWSTLVLLRLPGRISSRSLGRPGTAAPPSGPAQRRGRRDQQLVAVGDHRADAGDRTARVPTWSPAS